MNKWLERFKDKKLDNARYRGDKVDKDEVDITTSTMSPGDRSILKNTSNDMSAMSIMSLKQELYLLIERVSNYYGGDDPAFLFEYFNDILIHNDLETALVCFRDVVKQLPSVNNRK